MKVLERADLRSMRDVRLVGEGMNDIVPVLDAWRKAEDEGLDLVLVSSPDATPPVVRIQDYKKLQYEKKKKQRQNKTKVELKEVQFKANISDHDIQTKVNNIVRFLERGDKVKIIVRLKGRERDLPQRAHDLLDRVVSIIETPIKVNKIPGPIASAIIEPGK